MLFLFNKEDVNYAIFKTLKPGLDDVSDIDVLCLGPYDYSKIVTALKQNDYLFMEKGDYCTTFQDTNKRFKIEAMKIDVYSEISITRLIYLNKKSLSPFKIKKDICEGFATYILRPEAELLAVIAHAALKENQYTLFQNMLPY